MTRISSFPPVSTPASRVLILGSMPGEASLAVNEYYAHSRNYFWKIMMEVLGGEPDGPYEKRLALLKGRHIALWDVLESCIRSGSLDSAITEERLNDFKVFFKGHPHVKTIFFNGRKAENAFCKKVLPELKAQDFSLVALPSTSPANASWSYERKKEAWQAILRDH